MVRSVSSSISYCPRLLIQWISVVTLLAATSGVFAQQVSSVAATHRKSKSKTVTDFSLGMFGQLTPVRTPTKIYSYLGGFAVDQTTQGTSSSAGVLGSVRQSFRPWFGYSVNFGYSRFSEKYSYGNSSPSPSQPESTNSYFETGTIGVSMYEFTGAYLFQGPKTRRFDTFLQLGGGALTFLPTKDPSPYWVTFRPVMVFGTGMNYKLSRHWALRAEYRALFYKNPDWSGIRSADTNVPTVKLYTVTNEPTISLVYRFGGKR